MNPSKNLYYGIGTVVAVLLVGGYVLLQGKNSTLPVSNVPSATTTAVVTTSPAQVTPPAAGGVKPGGTIAVTQAGDVKIDFDTTNLHTGGTISTITMTLPKDSDGKALVLSLKSVSSTTVHEGILLATIVHPSAPTYLISGLGLTKMTDPTNGSKVNVVPGTYVIQAVLWDRMPFGPAGTYSNLSGNNGNGTQSSAFTISAAQ